MEKIRTDNRFVIFTHKKLFKMQTSISEHTERGFNFSFHWVEEYHSDNHDKIWSKSIDGKAEIIRKFYLHQVMHIDLLETMGSLCKVYAKSYQHFERSKCLVLCHWRYFVHNHCKFRRNLTQYVPRDRHPYIVDFEVK